MSVEAPNSGLIPGSALSMPGRVQRQRAKTQPGVQAQVRSGALGVWPQAFSPGECNPKPPCCAFRLATPCRKPGRIYFKMTALMKPGPLSLLPRSAQVGPPHRRKKQSVPPTSHPTTSQEEHILGPKLALEIPLPRFYCQLCCLRF